MGVEFFTVLKKWFALCVTHIWLKSACWYFSLQYNDEELGLVKAPSCVT